MPAAGHRGRMRSAYALGRALKHSAACASSQRRSMCPQ